ncbi:hypothetical protein [Rhodanobacter lindaniclasticus]
MTDTLGVLAAQAAALLPQATQAVDVAGFHHFGDELGRHLGLLLKRLELQLGDLLQALQGERVRLERAVDVHCPVKPKTFLVALLEQGLFRRWSWM